MKPSPALDRPLPVSTDSTAGCTTVAFLVRDLGMGGAERTFIRYVNGTEACRPVAVLLRREGDLLNELAPHVPLFDLATPVADSVARQERHDGDNAAALPLVRAGFTPLSVIRLAVECFRLRRILQLTDCRLVSSFLMRSHIVALLVKRFLDPGVRVVINVHEHMSESAEHLYPTRLDRQMMRWVTRHLFPLADAIVVVAESLRADLITKFGIPAAKITVVYNPIDLEDVRRRAQEPAPECETRAGERLIVAVGRLVKLKGMDVLIRALARLPSEARVRLVVVGGGPEWARLSELVTALRVKDRVQFVGLTDNPWKYMARADAFVLPSLTEAFPNVVGEALALGVPVVAADCSAGVREYLEDGRCGLLVPPGDEAALATTLETLLRDDALRASLAARGPVRMTELDLPRVVERYETILLNA